MPFVVGLRSIDYKTPDEMELLNQSLYFKPVAQ